VPTCRCHRRRLGQRVGLAVLEIVDPPQPRLVELTAQQLEPTPCRGRDLLL
jgi:hypothetical protein